LCTDPFRAWFSMEDVFISIGRRLDRYEALLERAAEQHCQLVVLTEDITALSRLMRYLDDVSLFRRAVEYQTGIIHDRFTALSERYGMHIVVCSFAAEGDDIFNVADLFAPGTGRIGRYRKVHLPQYELWQVKPGDAFPAFETELGWISMLICYDQMWPEASTCCALNGAQIICHPSAAVLRDYRMRTRAMDHQLFYVSSCRQESRIVSPRAEILADGGDRDPAVIWADTDVQGATLAQPYFYETLYSGIRDHKERHLKFRHPESYGVITRQRPPLHGHYPAGGVADTPEKIEKVYTTMKEMIRRHQRGEPVPYHWRW
jgi:predicted amidohydrolase